ncbi:KpsF/GutQ family sugar-phosphate isomerase, partial [Bradyrhizobium guangdongense]|uniref:CBS domain-containing protein n=1 Tax=Bradyrhizobium guangdongense TaxID=1325090 RepID=UPI0011274638
VEVDEIMTKQPKTVPPSMMATEMIEVLNSRKITTLIVTEANKPVGIVHLHDLLRAGVA